MWARARRGELTVLEEDKPEGVIRQLVRYEVEPGLATEAYLLKPAQSAPRSRRGAAVFLQTTSATIREPAGLAGLAPPQWHIQIPHK